MTSLRAAIVGLGFVGKAHLEALRRQGIPVQGILSSSPLRTNALCDRLNIERGYTSLDELLSDPAVDVVHICTPNHLHFEQAQAALKAHKHVMCEKPLAINTEESEALAELARAHDTVAGLTYNLRYYPLCQEARSMVAHGMIGEPCLVHGSFLQDWLLYPTDWNWRLDPKIGGELRAIADIGTHWMDLVSWIVNKRVTEVCADLATVVPHRRRPRGRVETFQRSNSPQEETAVTTDDYGSVLLHLEDSVRGAMTVSQVSAGRKARLWFEIDGSAGSIAWNSELPNTLWIGKRHGPNQEMPKDPTLMTPEARGYAAYPGGHPEGYPDTFARLFEDFYQYIAAGNLRHPRSFPTFETGCEEAALCEAIATSAHERRWVTLAPREVFAPTK